MTSAPFSINSLAVPTLRAKCRGVQAPDLSFSMTLAPRLISRCTVSEAPRPMQRRPAIAILDLNIGTTLDQHPSEIEVVFCDGFMQRRFARGTLGIRIGAMLDQQPCDT
eukprot:m.236864 g.236864  ORF g.236864 m.236864 type:complete len:109 (+) comp17106_c1_seq6:643-969(+)